MERKCCKIVVIIIIINYNSRCGCNTTLYAVKINKSNPVYSIPSPGVMVSISTPMVGSSVSFLSTTRQCALRQEAGGGGWRGIEGE